MKKKKCLVFAGMALMGAVLATSAMAVDGAGPDRAARKAAFKESLTTEQKTCLDSHPCPAFNKESAKDDPANTAARDCKRDAMAACGVEKPMQETKAAGADEM